MLELNIADEFDCMLNRAREVLLMDKTDVDSWHARPQHSIHSRSMVMWVGLYSGRKCFSVYTQYIALNTGVENQAGWLNE